MALATQCPHCGTMFRVASDQLKLRGGIVRCGACQEIFDGSATLVDLDKLPVKAPAAASADAAASSVPAASTPPVAPDTDTATADDALPFVIVEPEDSTAPDSPAAPALPESPDFDGQPVYTLDFDHTFDPLGILPKVASPDAGGEAEPAAPADEDIDPLSLLQPWSRPPADAEPTVQEVPSALDDEGEAEAEAETAVVAAEPAPAAPAHAPAPAAVAPAPAGRYEPTFDLPVDEELVAAPLPGHEPDPQPVISAAPQAKQRAHDAPPLLTRESAASIATAPAAALPPMAGTPAAKRAEKAAARRSKLTPTKIGSQPKLRVAEIDEPEFVKRSRHQEQLGRTRRIAMLAGSIVLLLVLIAQGAITFRNALAARFPSTKAALASSCALLGCRVELPAQVDKLVIETGELTTLGGNAYSFTTELRNGAGTAQAWPSLELTLIDANDKPLVRRVFPPTDYLAPETPLANGMAPGAEQPVKLRFRVDDLKPSGYHIAVFYP
ncbi:zinc-ribbon and DUF3426 domain-containing protein [Massilia niabensis]|uniref:Zinc-ribbon and DUF3426 domain-containing protein n=1 Tax=Massilia niabensis TaxID=544910 RepID=A0ABW0L771_9BURK